jgi:hypothetical protein
MKKSPFKQTMPSGVRDLEDDLSSDYKGHMERLGSVEPFKLVTNMTSLSRNAKEAIEYSFRVGDRVRLVRNFNRTGEISACVPGNGSFPWYFVRFNDGYEDRFTSNELESE